MTVVGRIAVALAAAVVAAGCTPDCTPRDEETRPNVILVTIDTLRADHVGAYGSRRPATPNIDRLAAEGRLFERAYSVSHLTLPSHTSILTSLPQAEHGIDSNHAQTAAAVPALPALFRAAGWRTGAFVGARHLGPTHALGQLLTAGLERYEAPRRTSRPFLAEENTTHVVSWMGAVCREPFFAWVHYWDPHMPYTPPPPWDTAYYAGDPRAPSHHSMQDVRLGWYLYDQRPLRAHLARAAADVRALKRSLGVSSREVRRLVVDPSRLSWLLPDPTARAEARRRVRAIADAARPGMPLLPGLSDWLEGVRDLDFALAQYAGEVAYVDAAIGTLRAELERLGIAGRTVVVVTADHGEALGEHGIWFEHLLLLEPHVRVPLVIWAPGVVEAGTERAPVDGLDVAPTLLGLAGIPVPPGMHGRNLVAGPIVPRPLVGEGMRSQQLSILHDGWRLVRSLRPLALGDDYVRDPGAVELYDLATDPGERDDRAASEPARARALGDALDSWAAQHRARAPAASVSPERAAELRALGYVE